MNHLPAPKSPVSEVQQASREAVDAARQSEQFALLLAAVQSVQQQPACGCQHGHQAPAARSSWTLGKVAAAVGAVCVCGGVATMFFLSVAIAAPSIAASLLVLWKLYQAVFNGQRK